ncbi:hypothetical protein EVAR_93637_1 [Eumeta japonica]|uniref:Integrase zinc-binding domain-containing protein n=1 Tax=Eumeta variegata TaxID=151549 RepID=A0A4C1TQL9_EUMVA|nr:hypothetical protein EVAR_93637_1 [Eumeta japonica]
MPSGARISYQLVTRACGQRRGANKGRSERVKGAVGPAGGEGAMERNRKQTRRASQKITIGTILTGIKYRNAIVYVDDVVVYGETFEEFGNALRDVLNRFREANLMVKSFKRSFGYESVTILRCMLDDVLKEAHDKPWIAGHYGLTKALAKLRERYFVKNDEKEVEKYIGSCPTSKIKFLNRKPWT